MPSRAVISLAANQAAIFPDVCVVCGKPNPGATTVDCPSLSKEEGGPLEVTVEAPCCRGCARRLSAYWGLRIAAGAVWFFVGGLPGWLAANLVRPWYDPVLRQYGFVAGLPFVVIAALSMIGGFFA